MPCGRQFVLKLRHKIWRHYSKEEDLKAAALSYCHARTDFGGGNFSLAFAASSHFGGEVKASPRVSLSLLAKVFSREKCRQTSGSRIGRSTESVFSSFLQGWEIAISGWEVLIRDPAIAVKCSETGFSDLNREYLAPLRSAARFQTKQPFPGLPTHLPYPPMPPP